MNMQNLLTVAAAALLACAASVAAAAPAAAAPATPQPRAAASAGAAANLPSDSVLQLSGTFTDQATHKFTLAERRGEPQLVGMFYAGCQSVCPLLIETSIALTKSLEPAQRNRLRVLLVSFDPVRDTPQALAQLAGEHHLDATRWTLARADAAVIRRLAAVLDIRYRQLENGEFNHTSALILLDGQGRMLARTEKLGSKPDAEFVGAIRKALQAR